VVHIHSKGPSADFQIRPSQTRVHLTWASRHASQVVMKWTCYSQLTFAHTLFAYFIFSLCFLHFRRIQLPFHAVCKNLQPVLPSRSMCAGMTPHGYDPVVHPLANSCRRRLSSYACGCWRTMTGTQRRTTQSPRTPCLLSTYHNR
jgi:hypothetical protein